MNELSSFFQRLAVDDGVMTAKNPSPSADTVSEAGVEEQDNRAPPFTPPFKIPRTASMPDEVSQYFPINVRLIYLMKISTIRIANVSVTRAVPII